MASILTPQQKHALELISQTKIAKQFYFSGGTALSHYYLSHRLSEDLDFFNEDEFDPQAITVILKSLQPKLGFSSFDFQDSFNRNLFFLQYKNDYVLKLEFTYYPFHQVESPTIKDGLRIDSVLDIATNKLFTISQKPRGRDYFDLFAIIKKYSYTIEQLRMFAKQKFDWHVDPLQLASRFNEIDQHLDDPILTEPIARDQLTSFFQQEAIRFTKQIVE
ncbi:MAG: nucleotidyl transferase AbiEii/AbiGii toxin family protein [bacterium]|nr:nucleotidyl transferase AbiEii/AbiGii toxin family protein [bacterium]